jgi:hypothetical protein
LDVTGSRAPDAAEDAFTRIWHRADASHGQYVQAIAELRERKRREQEAPQLDRRRWSRIRGVSNPGVPARERADGLLVATLVDCERCEQPVERAGAQWVAISSRVGEPVEHPLCPRCAEEVRRGLMRLLVREEPLTAPPHQEEQEMPLALPARAGWFLLRMGAYGLIGLAVFGFVAWVSVR